MGKIFCSTFTILFLWAELNAQPTQISPIIRLEDSVRCTSVKDQAQSPTCWVFGTNSLFESDLLRRTGIEFNLSEMFIARYAYIDKAQAFLASHGKTYYEGGGQFHDVIRVMKRFGIVPEEVYTGKLHGETMYNHARLDTAMKIFANRLLKQGKTTMNRTDLVHINDTLDRYLGKVPVVFWFKGKKYTPLSFAAAFMGFQNDYVEMVSFADHPLYRRFILRDKFNWASDSFYNIALSDMQAVVDTALIKGWSVGWEGDVTEPGFSALMGTASISDSLQAWDEERITNYANESTERDHMLHIVGLGRDSSEKKWYYMKNSWGTWFSKYDGFLYMQEDYFKLKTVILFVNKEALPQSLKKKLSPDGRVL